MHRQRRSGAFSVVTALLIALASTWVIPAASFAKAGNEQQWIVESIAKDIAEIVLFAASKEPDAKIDLETIKYTTSDENPTMLDSELRWGTGDDPIKGTIALSNYVWNPDNYSPWALQVLTRFKLHPTDSTDTSPELIGKLSDYSSEVIATENKNVTQALTGAPLDSNLHEQAALLCAILALRETSACFSDVRPALDRICCHLAVARALRGTATASDAGKLAEIVMNALCGRQADAIKNIELMERKHPSERISSWLRALRIRITEDFRIADLKKATLIERYEYGRALSASLGTDALTDFLEKDNTGAPIEWTRLALRQLTSVESGHTYAETGINAEAADLTADYLLYHDATKKVDPIDELNKQPTGCLVKSESWQLEPISWQDLAAFHCRHLLNSVFEKHHFEQKLWGVPDQAEETMEMANKAFSRINLYPVCQVDMTSDIWDKKNNQPHKAGLEFTNTLVGLLSDSPTLVNAELWHVCVESAAAPDIVPARSTWFKPLLLYGTSFDVNNRDPKSLDVAQLEKLKELSPYDLGMLRWLTWKKFGKHQKAEDLKPIYGAFADYSLSTMRGIAYADGDTATRAALFEKVAKFQPSSYFELGDFYVTEGQPKKARDAYEKAVSLGRDSVQMANNCRWLVIYYFDHGQKDKALKLASEAAEVYSNGGLKAMARLQERMGNLKSAEDYYAKANERYENPTGLCLFYLRHQDNAVYKSKGQALLKTALPGGIEKVTAESFKAAPKNGCMINSDCSLTFKYGLSIGDVIVATDGYMVHNSSQYNFLRDIGESVDTFTVVVWNGKTYRTIKAVIPDKRFGCDEVDFKG